MALYAFSILVAGIAVGTTASWALQKWIEIRARLHYARRFFAGIEALRGLRIPDEGLRFLEELAELINEKKFATLLVNHNPSHPSSALETNSWIHALNEEQVSVFVQTLTAFVMSASYLTGKSGRKFRTKWIDRYGDRRRVITETETIQRIIETCPEPMAA